MQTQELIQIYHLLREQEGKMVEIHRSLRAVLETLVRENPEFYDAYRQSYESRLSSEVALGYAPTLEAIDEKIRDLKERKD